MPPVRLYPPVNPVQINLAAPARGGWWVGERKRRPPCRHAWARRSSASPLVVAGQQEIPGI